MAMCTKVIIVKQVKEKLKKVTISKWVCKIDMAMIINPQHL